MYQEREDLFYYLTLYNENYPMLPQPAGVEEGILAGLYRLETSEVAAEAPHVQLFGSGTLLEEARRARRLLGERFGIGADVWSATSYKELRREALACERWNRLHPDAEPRVPYVSRVLAGARGPVVAVTDYLKLVPEQIARWVPGGLVPLGTDGFGRSESRAALRRHFEVDAESIAFAAVAALARRGEVEPALVLRVRGELGLDPERPDPARA